MMITAELARKLIDAQFPQWKDLPIRPVSKSGWDNRTFHLGETMSIRMPSNPEYEGQVEKEQFWLPKLAPYLPLHIPQPIALGQPGEGYPMKWSIYRWLEGEAASTAHVNDLNQFAGSLAEFILKLHEIDTTSGPEPGPHNFYRGGDLATYDKATREAIKVLGNTIDGKEALQLWESASKTSWTPSPVWIHGDIALGNLLIKDGKLSAVIDFGQLGVGDPACDLAITWTFFKDESREIFEKSLKLDDHTWLRGKAWTLWKALVTAAGFTNPNNAESVLCHQIIERILVK